MDVIYSSELVPPGLIAPPARDGETLTQRARDALAAHGLALRTVGANTFVVVPAATPAVESEEPLEEISVYASRYAIDGGLAEPREVSPTDIERVPGSHDDALRALHSLPGIATNASARPYIRGSLSEDVLVRYDGIGLLDPYHLKNFQSLISAIDPAGIERIEVFSGGFPVRYGTRSGGVIACHIRVSVKSGAAAMPIRPATRSRRARAASRAIQPPIEEPISTSGPSL